MLEKITIEDQSDHETKSNFDEDDEKIQPDQSKLLSNAEVENQSEGEELAKATKVSQLINFFERK